MSDILSVRGDFSAAFQEVRQAKPEDFKARTGHSFAGRKNGGGFTMENTLNIYIYRTLLNIEIEPEIHET